MRNKYFNNIILSNNFPIQFVKQSLLVIAGSLVLALASHIYIPVYPVPFTMQSLAVMLIAASLGSRLGVYTILLYIVEAFMGLPVTASKLMGMSLLTAPSFGYIIGYIFMAYIIGLMKDKGRDKKISTAIPYVLLGNQVMFAFGVLYLSYFLGSIKQGFLLGYVPFVLFDLIKVSIVVLGVNVISRFRNNN